MKPVDMECRWDHVDPILWDGDGTALFVMEWRRNNPPAGPKETVAEYWQRIDAVAAYRKSVSTWREDASGELLPHVRYARAFRREHPGCAFGEVVAYIAQVNEADDGQA
jgi:hypothetical protein